MSREEWIIQGGLSFGALQGAVTGDIITAVVMGGLAALAIFVSRAERRDRDQWK
jgi:hypothetical protein